MLPVLMLEREFGINNHKKLKNTFRISKVIRKKFH
jgi:hypothetical protein